MQFTKTREVKSPCRANATDAGMDFFVPTDLNISDVCDKNKNSEVEAVIDFRGDNQNIGSFILPPQERVLIPCGIHVKVPEGHALILFNKSGVATKLGLDIGACVVDEPYTGEVHINLINTTSKPVTIEAGQKIVQGLIIPINYSMPDEVKDLDTLYKDFESTRGAGGFGSTGVK